jgi:hypothetical protein
MQGQSGLASYVARLQDGNLTWSDLEWLRSQTRLPVLVKGISRGDDARRALDCGAAGVTVSNHGGRQLDTARPAIHALPEVVEAVAGRAEILIRRDHARSDCLTAAAGAPLHRARGGSWNLCSCAGFRTNCADLAAGGRLSAELRSEGHRRQLAGQRLSSRRRSRPLPEMQRSSARKRSVWAVEPPLSATRWQTGPQSVLRAAAKAPFDEERTDVPTALGQLCAPIAPEAWSGFHAGLHRHLQLKASPANRTALRRSGHGTAAGSAGDSSGCRR